MKGTKNNSNKVNMKQKIKQKQILRDLKNKELQAQTALQKLENMAFEIENNDSFYSGNDKLFWFLKNNNDYKSVF